MSGLRDVAAFCALAWLWGSTFAAVEIGLVSFPPLLLLALRYYLAGVLLLGYVVRTTDASSWCPTTAADALAIGGGGLFWIAVGNGVWFVGQELTTSVLSGLMTALIPILTTAFSWVLLPEDRLTPLSVVGLGISFAGAVLIVQPSRAAITSAEFVGKGLLFAGVLGSALGSVVIRRAAAPISSTAQTAWAVLLGAGVIHGLHLGTGGASIGSVAWRSVAALLYLSIPATVVAYVLFFSLLERRSAIETTLVTYLVPIVATGLGWVLFSEPLTTGMLAGFLLILVGFAVMKRRALRAELARLDDAIDSA